MAAFAADPNQPDPTRKPVAGQPQTFDPLPPVRGGQTGAGTVLNDLGSAGQAAAGSISGAGQTGAGTVLNDLASSGTSGAGQPWYNQNDIGTFQNWAQQRYGRQATPEELAQIGANSTSMATAQSYADTLARQQGWQPSSTTTPTTPYTPGPGVAPPGPGLPPLPASTPPGVPGVGTQAPTLPPATSPADPNRAAMQNRIAQLLQTQTGDVNTGSQEYQSQLGAFKRGQNAQLERAKLNAASRGGTTGGAEGVMQGMDLAAAGQAGDFEAQLAGQQISRQREDLQQALQLAQQNGLAGEARQLQERMAQLDAQMQQQGLNLQGYLGQGNLDLQRYLGQGGLGMQQQGLNLQGELGRGDLDLRRYLGRGQLGLGLLGTLLQDRQAGNALGFNYANLQNTMNQQTLQQILGGL